MAGGRGFDTRLASTSTGVYVKFDFYTSLAHYADHLRPVWEALPEDELGKLSTKGRPKSDPDTYVCVASIGDFRQFCRHRTRLTMQGHQVVYETFAKVVLFEHGVGYSFHGDPRHDMRNGSYAGGLHRDQAVMLPATNHFVQEQNLLHNPNVPSPIVGCPKLDAMVKAPRPDNPKPVVCVSFHWDCRVCPETRWAFSWYGAALAGLRDCPEFELIAHGHPRMDRFWHKWFGVQRIEYVPTFDEVVARADCYINDSSSTLYEFAALDRPVVVLNAPWYRRDVHHGLRFWKHADVGIQVDQPVSLLTATKAALSDPRAVQKARRAAVADVYPYLGCSVDRTIEVLHSLG